MLALAAVAAVPVANAATTDLVRFIGEGSSAMYTMGAIAAQNDLSGLKGGGNGHHATYSATATGCIGKCGQIKDQRVPLPPLENGQIWIVWGDTYSGPNGDCASGQTCREVWAYIQLDSTVGCRMAYANPRPLYLLDSAIRANTATASNLINQNLFNGHVGDEALPTDVYDSLNGFQITAGLSDIRPEDCKLATSRALNPLSTPHYAGLGYGTSSLQLIGTPVVSGEVGSTSSFTPVNFALKGNDPFNTKNKVTSKNIVDIGAESIMFVINRSNTTGLGNGGGPTNIKTTDALTLFDGDECDTNVFSDWGGKPANTAVHVFLREPLSGTMNTTEFSVFRVYTTKSIPDTTQEKNVNPAVDNNSNYSKPCVAGGGDRTRGIGTGEVVNGCSSCTSGVKGTADSIAYTFFAFGNISKIATSTAYSYLTVDGVDPLFNTYCATGVCTGGNPGQAPSGQLPACVQGTSCDRDSVWGVGNNSFPHLVDGTYRAFNILRAICELSDTNCTTLVADAQSDITGLTGVADFLPYASMPYYRSHYKQSAIAGNNGFSTKTEAGGDEGGCVLEKLSFGGTLDKTGYHQGYGTPAHKVSGSGNNCFSYNLGGQ
jgi:hypothetical protein